MRPTLEARDLRVDVDGVPDVDGLSLETSGDRVLVLAAPGSLFRVAGALTTPRRGEVLTDGLTPAEAVAARRLAIAMCDPPLPPAWTTSEYMLWSTRLAGHSKAAAEPRVHDALRKMKLEALAGSRLRHVPPHARRAIGVAAALATGATTLFLEDPERGLAEDAARNLSRTIVRATEGLRTVIFASRTSLASPLGMDADEALVIAGREVVAQGAPAEVAAHDRTYAIRLNGPGAAFAELAERRGARISGQGASWVVDLGATPDGLRVSDILDVAQAVDAVVMDLRPLAQAFG
jgi:ABC-type multidrug transport system ATPase subunit